MGPAKSSGAVRARGGEVEVGDLALVVLVFFFAGVTNAGGTTRAEEREEVAAAGEEVEERVRLIGERAARGRVEEDMLIRIRERGLRSIY